MVKSFNEIAKAVNIKTVAEYVENENIKNIPKKMPYFLSKFRSWAETR